jgi:hypothetical protein
MTEAKFSFTTKINGDLLTVRGDTAQEFNNNLDAFLLSPDTMSRVWQVQVEAHSYSNDGAPTPAPSVDQAAAAVSSALDAAPVAAPAPAATVAAPQAVEQQTDRWGKLYTRGLPGAPVVPNGAMLLLEAKSKAGKPYKCWVDPLEGPWPVKKITEKAERQWVDS